MSEPTKQSWQVICGDKEIQVVADYVLEINGRLSFRFHDTDGLSVVAAGFNENGWSRYFKTEN